MRPIVITAGPFTAASATNIRTAGAVAGAGALVLNGSLVASGVAILDAPRRILITSSGDDSGITFTLTGANSAGDTLTEVLAGTNASSSYSVLDYKTLSSVVASGAAAANVSVGTNGVGGSPWARLDEWALPNVSVQSVVSGTINYTVQYSNDDPNSPTDAVAPASMTWNTLTAAGDVTAVTNAAYAPLFVRVLVNSNTAGGYVRATVVQTGVVPF